MSEEARLVLVNSLQPGQRLGVPSPESLDLRIAHLTAREVDILRLLARGLSNKQMAARPTISAKTASTHVEHIYTKLGVTNRAMASLFAAKHGLITAGEEDQSATG